MKDKLKKKTLILGITGSFGSGKTTVAAMFKRLGASCIDADRIYHGLINPKSLIYKKIVAAFGRRILGKNNRINRKKLAGIVFGKGRALKRLSRITHPAIISRIKSTLARLKRTKRKKIIVIDAPLLMEAGLIKMLDRLLVVKINRRNQIKRIRKQRSLSGRETIKRIKAQAPLAEKVKLADYLIDNNGALKQTRKQAEKIWKQINKRQRDPSARWASGLNSAI